MTSQQRYGDLPSLIVFAPRDGRADAVIAAALGVALAYGALDQGAFYPERFANLLGLVAVAALARAVAGFGRGPGYLVGCAAAWLGFAGWALLDAGWHGPVGAGAPAAAVATCLAAAAWSAGGLADSGRRLITAVIVAVGLVVAATGWVGVALHQEPLALPSSGLWRAASTVTYANATAALLVIAVLVALAVLPEARRGLSTAVVAALLVGLAATMSRAGLLALVIGLAVAVTAPTLRGRVARCWPAGLAAVPAFAGLLPALPDGSDPNPVLALAGLLGGAAVLVLADRRPRLTVIAAFVAAAVAMSAIPSATLASIGHTRLSAASPERADLVRVTLDQLVAAPAAGVGPGRLDLAYVDHNGVPVLARFTHQEYLQMAAETGLVGLGLVLAGIGALAVGALRRRGRPGAPGPTAALAVLAAFGVHSAFDFLWHIPVLPLLAVLAAVALVHHHHHHLEQENP